MGCHRVFTQALHIWAAGTRNRQTDDFSALQQHIDELTRENFELTRGLDTQRRVAQTLAEENQHLTADFNRQVTIAQMAGKICLAHMKLMQGLETADPCLAGRISSTCPPDTLQLLGERSHFAGFL